MIQSLAGTTISDLYESDETAWLERMADLIHQGRLDVLDYPHLGEYLSDMARRDRREVESRGDRFGSGIVSGGMPVFIGSIAGPRFPN